MLRPLEGPTWHYRYRARLSVRYVAKKGTVLIGFHERKSRYLADMQVCPVLPAQVSAMLMPLRELIGSMDARDTCPQIELACGDAPGLRRAGRDRAGAAASGAAVRCRHRAAEGLRRANTGRAVVAAGEGPGHGAAAGRRRPAAGYELPEFGIRCPSSRPISRRSIRTSIACWSVAPAPARRAAGRARDRLVLRPGQLHAAAGDAARARCWASRAATRWWRAPPTTIERNRAAAGAGLARSWCPTTFVARNLFEMTPAMLVARRRCADNGWWIRRARAPSRWPRRWPTCTSSVESATQAAAGRRPSASST